MRWAAQQVLLVRQMPACGMWPPLGVSAASIVLDWMGFNNNRFTKLRDRQNSDSNWDRIVELEHYIFELTILVLGSSYALQGCGRKTLNLFRAQQWISNEYFDIARVNLEQSATFSKRTDGLMGQYMITGYIYLVDTTVDVHGPRSISWSFMFCKVPVNRIALQRLTNNELHVLEKNMFYAPKRQWLDTTGPYRRVLHEKFIASRQYLPRNWNMMVLLLLACGAFAARSVVNSSLDETLDKEKTREAIRLWIFEMHMQSILTLPTISEGEMNIGKTLLDRVCIGQPEFQSGLIYNSTVDKTV
uniref:Uncharacterized protein n=1 Tax=Romanomermis culicivorax TaxID=13658 RepID=A0A915HRV1_ROMCU